jgi:hypothetical protein
VRITYPDWTSEEIMKVRKIFRSGGTVQDVKEALDTPMTTQVIRDRSIKLGMRFLSAPRSHLGTSKMVLEEKPLGDRHK